MPIVLTNGEVTAMDGAGRPTSLLINITITYDEGLPEMLWDDGNVITWDDGNPIGWDS